MGRLMGAARKAVDDDIPLLPLETVERSSHITALILGEDGFQCSLYLLDLRLIGGDHTDFIQLKVRLPHKSTNETHDNIRLEHIIGSAAFNF